MGELPPGATDASRRLLAIAEEMVARCPPELGLEIALTGSVARGWADEHSDVELAFWVHNLDWPAACEGWLQDIGATNLNFYPETEDGPQWIEFEFKGIPAEAGWDTFARCQAALDDVLAGRPTPADMTEGFMAEALQHSAPLRDGEHLRRWKRRLRRYPDILRDTLITEAAATWSRWPRWFELTSAFAARPDPSDLLDRYDMSIRAVLRILFAVNRQWEPGLRKWTRRWTETLEIKPEGLADRIFAIYERPLETKTWLVLLSLMRDTLDLVPTTVDVTNARELVERALTRYASE